MSAHPPAQTIETGGHGHDKKPDFLKDYFTRQRELRTWEATHRHDWNDVHTRALEKFTKTANGEYDPALLDGEEVQDKLADFIIDEGINKIAALYKADPKAIKSDWRLRSKYLNKAWGKTEVAIRKEIREAGAGYATSHEKTRDNMLKAIQQEYAAIAAEPLMTALQKSKTNRERVLRESGLEHLLKTHADDPSQAVTAFLEARNSSVYGGKIAQLEEKYAGKPKAYHAPAGGGAADHPH